MFYSISTLILQRVKNTQLIQVDTDAILWVLADDNDTQAYT